MKVVLNDLYERLPVWTERQKDEILTTYDGYEEDDTGVIFSTMPQRRPRDPHRIRREA